eukprot:6205911-Pleurochrysis_carterae.AAC.2
MAAHIARMTSTVAVAVSSGSGQATLVRRSRHTLQVHLFHVDWPLVCTANRNTLQHDHEKDLAALPHCECRPNASRAESSNVEAALLEVVAGRLGLLEPKTLVRVVADEEQPGLRSPVVAVRLHVHSLAVEPPRLVPLLRAAQRVVARGRTHCKAATCTR